VRLGTIVDGIWDDDSWSHRAPTRKRSVGVISHSNVAPGELSPPPAQTGGTSPTGRRRWMRAGCAGMSVKPRERDAAMESATTAAVAKRCRSRIRIAITPMPILREPALPYSTPTTPPRATTRMPPSTTMA
jgi:hypothetical protein